MGGNLTPHEKRIRDMDMAKYAKKDAARAGQGAGAAMQSSKAEPKGKGKGKKKYGVTDIRRWLGNHKTAVAVKKKNKDLAEALRMTDPNYVPKKKEK